MWFPAVYKGSDLFALKHVLYFLNISGLYSLPCNENNHSYEIIYKFYFVVVTSSTLTVTVFTALDLFDNLYDVDVLADHGVIFAALLVIIIKQYSLVRHKIRIEIWVAEVQRRFLAANKIERIRFIENDEENFHHIKIFFGIWILITCSYLLPIYLRPSDQFLLPTLNAAFFGVDSTLKYVFVYAWNTAALSLAILGVFSADLFMVGIYKEAASRLEALGNSLETIGHDEFNPRATNGQCSPASIRRFVKKSVVEHIGVMKLIGELNHVFYWTLLVQSVFVNVIIAGCGFYGFVSIVHGNIASFIKSIMYISGVICENWLYCTFGDRLKSASLNVVNAVWKSNWYKLGIEDRKSVLLIMMGSEKVLYMSAGNIFRMDLERLGFILSSAYSYFTVLRNFA